MSRYPNQIDVHYITSMSEIKETKVITTLDIYNHLSKIILLYCQVKDNSYELIKRFPNQNL